MENNAKHENQTLKALGQECDSHLSLQIPNILNTISQIF